MDQILPSEPQEKEKLSRIRAILEALGLSSRVAKNIFAGSLVIIISLSVLSVFLIPPKKFPVGETISVERGAPLGSVSLRFKERNLIRSQFVFKICMVASGGDRHIVAGDYLFKEPLNVCTVAWRVAHGLSGVPAVRITIPEGTSNQGIADIIAPKLSKFDKEFFLNRARSIEGFLFPDTYFFSSGAGANDVIKVMNEEFKKKIEPWTPLIGTAGRTERDVVIMASLLEKEAKTEEDQALVAGILWKRIEIGMPLQVDAPFYYLLSKTSRELTQADLAMQSAYNTYKNKGLPAGPIGSPGIAAIRAAVFPKSSPYLYYLSDNEGNMHYARTFAEHGANKAKYLK